MIRRQVFAAGIAGVLMVAAACAPPSPTAVRMTPESEVDHQGALISADGSTVVASTSIRNEIAVIDVASNDYHRLAVDDLFSLHAIAGNGDHALVLRFSDDPIGVTVSRVDLRTDEMIDVFDPEIAFDAQISDDGSTITRPSSVCDPTNCTTTVQIWKDGERRTVEIGLGSAFDQYLSPDGSHYIALVGTWTSEAITRVLYSVDTTTGEVTTLDIAQPATGVQSIDGTSVSGDELRVTDTAGDAWSIGAGHAPTPRRRCGSSYTSPYSYGVPSPNGAYCVEQVYPGNGTKLQVVDLTTGAVRFIVSTDSAALSPRISARPSVADSGRTVYGYRLVNETGAALYIDG